MGKKRGTSETLTTIEQVVISSEDIPEATEIEEEDAGYANLLEVAQEIRNEEGILGYILRGETQAMADLNEPTKITEYALLSSQTFESSETFAESFNLGNIQNVVIEGKKSKAICVNFGSNKLSVFMDRNVAHDHLLDAIGKDNILI